MAQEKQTIDDNIHWYKDAVIYELHIKAFKDGNGDGIGDFKGLMEKLDYLEDLGVTAIWLLPFYPSPLRDDGYDIADYYNIHPSYGTIHDFKNFMKEAKRRGLKVITELVINHSSDQHPWFQRARRAKPGSPFRDFYVWSDSDTKYKDVRIIFTDTERSNWTWDPVAKAYYWHRFFSHQPDLNYDNPAVQQEVFRVLEYWLNMGVDGFRLDAVPYLFEREGTNGENLPETHVFLKKLRAHVDAKYPGKCLLAEANMWPEDSASYFGNGDECHMNYHFPIMPRMFMSLKMEDRFPITDIIDQTPSIPETCQWAIFLRNHDELTLEMVTDEERDYMYRVYTKDPQAKINLGIRHRLAPLLDNNRKKIELMNTLLFSLPGTPVLYYGDEIGMGDNYYLKDRDGVRTPMQWNDNRNGGFSVANPQQLYLPTIADPEYSFDAINVETQQKNLSSLLWWNKRVINMRKRYKAFSRGDIKFLSPANAKVLAFTRTYQDEIMLVVANLSRFSQAAELDLCTYKDYTPIEVFSQNKFPNIKDDPYLFTLGPHAYYWCLLKKTTTDIDQLVEDTTPKFAIKDWEQMRDTKVLRVLENQVLPRYIPTCRWFGGKARTVQQMKVMQQLDIIAESGNAVILIVEVRYNEGLPEFYLLPLAFATGDEEKSLRDNSPRSVIASMIMGEQKGVLFDAVYSEHFRQALFRLFTRRKRVKEGEDELHFYVNKEFDALVGERRVAESTRVLSAEQSNTSIVFEDKLFFKLYRRVDTIINPDVEISRFLSEKADFAYTPKYLGHIELKQGKQSWVFGILQEWVPNQGDAWAYFGDVVTRYFERILEAQVSEPQSPDINTLYQPIYFSDMPEDLQQIIGGAYVERVTQLAQRTAEMHLALASQPEEKGFEPEDFSLHYQRSLFSSLQTLVRTVFTTLENRLKSLPEQVKGEAEEIMRMRTDILKCLQRVYTHKFETTKIRVHGDYHLGQVLFTGKDFMILDFEGEPARAFSERRLKRSPLRDVAGMIRSFHYAAFYELIQNETIRKEDQATLTKWAEQWYYYVSGFYMQAYMEKVKGTRFIPDSPQDFNVLLETFLLEKAIYELGYELNNRPDWVGIPIRGIKYIMQRYFSGLGNA
jgi:maltose alpha-D-glucosyltransferase/alpha-amylase